MMPFLRSLWPNHVPPQVDRKDQIATLRERILQYFLWLAFVFVIIASILVIPDFIQLQRWPVVIILTLSVIVIGSITTMRGLPYRLRAATIAVVIYVIGAGSLLIYGLSGNGPILLAGFIALCALFLGTWPGITAGIAVIVTMALVGVLSIQKPEWISNLILPVNPENPLEWIHHALVIGLASGFITISLALLLNGLRHAMVVEQEMTSLLKTERDSLDTRVIQRTLEVEKHAQELETASKIAQQIAQFSDLDQLLSNAVDLIASEYAVYFSCIFLVDARKEFAMLRAGSGEAGRSMLAMNYRLKIGETSMVGYAIMKQETRLSQDVAQDPIHFKNPLLPETRSELVIPLIASHEVIGVLDVQGSQPRFFTPNNIRALQIAADQLAVAIEKAGLIARLSQKLEDLQAGYRTSTRQAWQGFIRESRKPHAYRQRQGQLAITPVQAAETNPAVISGQTAMTVKSDPSTGLPFTIVSLPIKLREEVIGVLDLRFEARQVRGNVVELLEAVAQRLALALENARLMEENQMRVSREHIVSEISARVRAETQIDKVLQTVAAELGRSMGVTDVLVQLRGASETREVSWE